MIFSLLQVIDMALQFYIFILIASAILSWLLAFNIINAHSPIVRSLGYFLYQLTEPVLSRIRRILPDLGMIDISPLIVFFIIYFIRMLMWNIYRGILF